MNTKKVSILSLALVAAVSSVFAWSKKSENTGNLGRMYVSFEGGAQFSKTEVGGVKTSPTGASAAAVINAPVFKPAVNVFKDIKWAGLDAQVFFNYDYSGKFDINGTGSDNSSANYGVGVALVPYLNFETGFEYFKAIKPFAKGFVAYEWYDDYMMPDMTTSDFAYGFQGGVEVVITDRVSLTPLFQWDTSADSNIPCRKRAGVELSFWFNDQIGTAIFWMHDFGATYAGDVDVKHGDVIGAKIKIGFMR